MWKQFINLFHLQSHVVCTFTFQLILIRIKVKKAKLNVRSIFILYYCVSCFDAKLVKKIQNYSVLFSTVKLLTCNNKRHHNNSSTFARKKSNMNSDILSLTILIMIGQRTIANVYHLRRCYWHAIAITLVLA